MVNAVICEFNPFHNGHKYLLNAAKEKTGAEYTVCFMSGNFVQRGEMAVCDKHSRAAAAVRHGADLVFEIPTAYVLASAAVFANAGVSLASSLGVDTTLCFGCEADDISPLYRLAKTNKEQLAHSFQKAVSGGKSYAAAVMQAYKECGANDADLLNSPNNLLAFEYIKAVVEQNSNIDTLGIHRIGTSHDGQKPSGIFASASYIRNHQNENLSQYLPEDFNFAIDKKIFDTVLLYSIYSKTSDELLQYADITEGLENRFFNAARTAKTADELITLVKSKRYTHAKLRRAAMNVLIGTPKDLHKQKPPYLRVLAFNSNGRALLKQLSDTASVPIVTKPATISGLKLFKLECRATDIYDFCSKNRHGGGREYRMSPVYVK